jgi:hypothetical protein
MRKTSLVLAMMLGLFLSFTVAVGISYAMSQADEALIRKIDGRRYSFDVPINNPNRRPGLIGATQKMIIDVRGNVFVFGTIYSYEGQFREGGSFEIQGRETRHQDGPIPGMSVWSMYSTYTISDDGEIITHRIHWSNGNVGESVYFWQR